MIDRRVNLVIADGIARLSFASADGRNAVSLGFARQFAEAAEHCRTRLDVRVILMRAEGPFFSVGGDLAEIVAQGDHMATHIFEMASTVSRAVEYLRAADAPVVLALNGTAAGGGFSFVTGADLVIAARSAKLVSAFTKSGLTPDAGASWFLPRIVGSQRAFLLLAMNPVLSAEEAERLGLVAKVVEDEALERETQSLVTTLAALPGSTLASLKQLLRLSGTLSLTDQLACEARSISHMLEETSTRAALEAFFRR